MRESDKHRFLDSPISQAGLFGDAVESFAQQFSAAQKQTEVVRHPALAALCCHHPAAGCSPSACSSPRAPPVASTSAPARPQQQPSSAWSWQQEKGAARLSPCQAREVPGQAPSLGRANPRLWNLLFRS